MRSSGSGLVEGLGIRKVSGADFAWRREGASGEEMFLNDDEADSRPAM